MVKKLLAFASYDVDADDAFTVEEEGFQELQTLYGIEIPEVARRQLRTIGTVYIRNRQSDLAWQSWQDVKALLPVYQEMSKAMWKVAVEGPHGTDAASEIKALFEEHLSESVVRLSHSEDWRVLIDAGWHSFAEKYEVPKEPLGVRLTSHTLFLIASELRLAVQKTERAIEKELEKPDPPQKRQTAIEAFILGLTEWAIAFDFPVSAYVHGHSPDKFACLACKLLEFAPDKFRESKFSTPGAMAAHIKRVRRAASVRKKEQKRKSIADGNAPLGSK